MNAQEKVSMQEFAVDTALNPESIREAGRRAAEAGTRFLDNKVVENGVADSSIRYVVTNPIGFMESMEIFVGWEELDGGQRRVEMKVGEFMTDRFTLWGFIPLGPKMVSAMGPLKRFSDRLRKELS